QQASPPVTHYREFTSRQTGMYRVTQMLTDDQAARVIRVGCRARFCLKRRLWTVPGLEPDLPEDKSIVPCLEPCAVLLEFARKAARIEQAQTVPLPVEDVATVVAALGMELERTRDDGREADFSDPLNRRRVQLLLERLTPSLLVPGQEHG
ncbi:MAG TPA: hypothetical protein VNO52_07375, partial [Methylomirabilota bacterium]|nr:hypothetical protein [Methylomirabilota bacterium]